MDGNLSRIVLVQPQPGGSLHPVMEQFKVPLFKGGFRGISLPSALFKSPLTPLFLLWELKPDDYFRRAVLAMLN